MNKTQTVDEVMAEIDRRMAEAKGDTKKEIAILESVIIDPQDLLNCEGCQ